MIAVDCNRTYCCYIEDVACKNYVFIPVVKSTYMFICISKLLKLLFYWGETKGEETEDVLFTFTCHKSLWNIDQWARTIHHWYLCLNWMSYKVLLLMCKFSAGFIHFYLNKNVCFFSTPLPSFALIWLFLRIWSATPSNYTNTFFCKDSYLCQKI